MTANQDATVEASSPLSMGLDSAMAVLQPLARSEEEQAALEHLMEEAAQKLKVCGHPVRLKLLYLIAREEDSCVSELWVCVNQPQPVVSQHLAVLKEKGIVKSEVKGNRRIYSIVDPFVADLVRSLTKA